MKKFAVTESKEAASLGSATTTFQTSTKEEFKKDSDDSKERDESDFGVSSFDRWRSTVIPKSTSKVRVGSKRSQLVKAGTGGTFPDGLEQGGPYNGGRRPLFHIDRLEINKTEPGGVT